MPRIVPQQVPETEWEKLPPNMGFAIRSTKDDAVNLRLGPTQGVYLLIGPLHAQSDVWAVQSVDYERGDPVLVGKLPQNEDVILGRTSECGLKVLHAIISRHHMMFRLEGTILIVRDLSSTNGTFCHTGNVYFDIDKYLVDHPLAKASESTLDQIHETFGPTLDDALKHYVEQGKTEL